MRKLKYSILFFGFFYITTFAQNPENDSIRSLLKRYETEHNSISKYSLRKVLIKDKQKKVEITISNGFAAIPFTEPLIESIKSDIKKCLAPEHKNYKIKIFSNGIEIEQLVPNIFRNEIDIDKSRLSVGSKAATVIKSNLNVPYKITKGLQKRNLAIWNSHGWFYEQKTNRWEWQRARILTTVEDKFTTQILINYLLPMLENSGASVFLPRERDPQKEMIVVDYDNELNNTPNGSIVDFVGDQDKFSEPQKQGFADVKQKYIDRENPFVEGSYNTIETDIETSAMVEYKPCFSKSGWYSVSVCYKSVAKGIEDAHYTVYHSGGATEFAVNQTIGEGTWIYLGSFYFEKSDSSNKVVLSNKSRHENSFVVADAVKFGGGIGNIARSPADSSTIISIPDPKIKQKAKLLSPFKIDYATTSGKAKFWEGARYYLQWSGAPFEVYSHTYGINDYTDDYASRGKWVNYLNYGSANVPDSVGLKIPIDLSLALHSDAGIDSAKTVGSLAIVSTKSNKKTVFPNSQSRYSSLDLANIILLQIKDDIDKKFDIDWTIRGINDASYAESRTPDVPSVILESMSHQNFYDMKLGLDPKFQFHFARAIYKGILRFIAYQNDFDYKVAPLPVNNFSAILDRTHNRVKLSWRATLDSIEKSAKPTGYVVYTRKQGLGFDNGQLCANTTITLPIGADTIYSYKITAINKGGESFPSEILSVCKASSPKPEVLIINGFTKTSAPQTIDSKELKGFAPWGDLAIAYKHDYSFTGSQYNFDTNREWTSNDSPGFGASYADYENMIVAGNSFDYPLVHGVSIKENGYSFSSCSQQSIENNSVALDSFKIVDIILGKQKRELNVANNAIMYKTIDVKLQERLTGFLNKGNSLLISGAYIGKDMCDIGSDSDRLFAQNVLKYRYRTDKADNKIEISGVFSPIINLAISNVFVCPKPNEEVYAVESPDAIEPNGENSFTIMRYNSNGLSAASAHSEIYKTVVLGFPLEAITDVAARNLLFGYLLDFLK